MKIYKVNKILGYYFKDNEGWWQVKAVNIANHFKVYPSFLFRSHWIEFEMLQKMDRKTEKQLNRYLKNLYRGVRL
jgi:hypothetical protein